MSLLLFIQVGACIVNEEKRIVGIGYNGMPNRCHDDEMSWERGNENPLDNKGLYGITDTVPLEPPLLTLNK